MAKPDRDTTYIAHAINKTIRQNENHRVFFQPANCLVDPGFQLWKMMQNAGAVPAAQYENNLVADETARPRRQKQSTNVEITFLC